MKHKVKMEGFTLAGTFLFMACGVDPSTRELQQTKSDPSVIAALSEEEISASYIPELKLSATEGVVRIKGTTLLKVSTIQGDDLDADEKCELDAGQELRFTSLGGIRDRHRFITLEKAPSGCSFQSGYLFEDHIELSSRKVYYAETQVETRFKVRVADSSDLNASEWCALPSDRKYALTGAPEDVGRGHARVTFAEGELPNCSFRTGFLFVSHFNQLIDAPQTSDFARVMKHILVWEGGCSDHPNDPGGRTYKGVTTARARMNGWTRDVCTMPDSLIFAIYREDYWNQRAARFAWPLNLAVMNTEVNSGGGKAQEFLNRMAAQGIQGSIQNRAAWFVDQQTAYYRLIANRNASLRVFLQGWINRSNYMQGVIAGRINLFEVEGMNRTAKALDE